MDIYFLAIGNNVKLRPYQPDDWQNLVRWWSQGEWLKFDAPWEEHPTMDEEARERFEKWAKDQAASRPTHRAVITLSDNIPIGWVNRYSKDGEENILYVGIDICEDNCLNRGYGTEALRLWVDYLFMKSDIHKLGLESWSFNPRMLRVAEKVGFVLEGRLREMRTWDGEWIDKYQFGILHREWEK